MKLLTELLFLNQLIEELTDWASDEYEEECRNNWVNYRHYQGDEFIKEYC